MFFCRSLWQIKSSRRKEKKKKKVQNTPSSPPQPQPNFFTSLTTSTSTNNNKQQTYKQPTSFHKPLSQTPLSLHTYLPTQLTSTSHKSIHPSRPCLSSPSSSYSYNSSAAAPPSPSIIDWQQYPPTKRKNPQSNAGNSAHQSPSPTNRDYQAQPYKLSAPSQTPPSQSYLPISTVDCIMLLLTSYVLLLYPSFFLLFLFYFMDISPPSPLLLKQ